MAKKFEGKETPAEEAAEHGISTAEARKMMRGGKRSKKHKSHRK